MSRLSLTSAKPWWLLFGLALALCLLPLAVSALLADYFSPSSIAPIGECVFLAGAILLVIAILAIPIQHGFATLGLLRFLGLVLWMSVACSIAEHFRIQYPFDQRMPFFRFLLLRSLVLAYGYASLGIARAFLRASATPRGWRLVEVALCGAFFATIFPLLFERGIGRNYMISELRDDGLLFCAAFVTFLVYLLAERRFPLPEPPDPIASRALKHSIILYYFLCGLAGLSIFTPSFQT